MRKSIQTTTFLTLTLFCLMIWGATAMAQVEEIAIGNTFGLGARAMGMGGAFLGIADDFTTLYWNPAGLAQIRRTELFGSFSHNEIDAAARFTRGIETEADRSKTRPNSIGLVYPLYTTRGGIAFALGYNRPQNFDSRIVIQGIDPSSDPDFGGRDVDETNGDEGGIGIWSLGTGFFISKNIVLGAAIDIWDGASLNELDTVARDLSGIGRIEFNDIINREYFGVGGRVGALAYFGEYVTLGLTAVFPMDLEVDEVWSQETFTVFDDGREESGAASGAIVYDIERPFEFGGGIALKLLEDSLTLGADVQFSDWTQTEYNPRPAEDIPRDNFERFYDSTIQVRAGAEYRIPGIDTSVCAGYFRDPISFGGKEIDSDRDFLTVGIGKIFDQVIKVDLAYMRGSWEQSDDSLIEKQTSNRVFLSTAYRY